MIGSDRERRLHRCADGELSHAEQAALLSELEERNDVTDWRALALAFVENQWITQVCRDAPIEQLRTAGSPIQERRCTSFRQVLPLTLMLLVGCGLGAVSSRWSLGPTDSRETIASAVKTTSPGPGGRQIAECLPQGTIPLIQPRPLADNEPVMNLEFVNFSGDPAESVMVPVFLPEQLASFSEHTSVSQEKPDWQRELEAKGYLVDRSVEHLEVPLGWDQTIIVPTESVQVKYALH